MPPEVPLVTLADVEAARPGLQPVLRPTPVESSPSLTELCHRPVLLKPEHRQRTGSFKIRGAHHLISHLGPEVTRIVAASAGNHAQGVALAATLAGKQSTIFMPSSAPRPKVAATRDYGADTILGHEIVDDCIAEAREFAANTGAHYVPPFDDPLIIAGQGTVGLELLEEPPEAEVVLVPVGGGGLLAGIAVALKALRPGIQVIGVEAEGAAAMVASLDVGRPVALESVRTIADGIAVKSPSDLTFAHVAALVDGMITVSDAEIGRAMVLLLERSKAVVEPAGAVGLAALLAGKVPGNGPALAILSGGNVDPLVLIRLIEHGLSAAGRYLRLRIVVPDRPGALARITSEVAQQGLNVLSVNHQREGSVVGVDEVEVLMTLETRDPAHRLQVVEALRGAGFLVDLVG